MNQQRCWVNFWLNLLMILRKNKEIYVEVCEESETLCGKQKWRLILLDQIAMILLGTISSHPHPGNLGLKEQGYSVLSNKSGISILALLLGFTVVDGYDV